MSLAQRIVAVNRLSQPLLWFAEPLALLTRLYVSWVFLKSGWLKVSDWESTKFLFHEEYRVPLLPPDLAAVFGAAGELFFPVLLILGVFSMFFIRDRRIWIFIGPDAGGHGSAVHAAMTSQRRTLDFNREFDRFKQALLRLLQ